MELLKTQQPDILFLDIDMPYFSGMDIAGFILEKKIRTILVFVTSHDALVYQSFAYRPFGFIRKTHMDTELPELAERMKRELDDRKKELIITKGQEIIRILIGDIVYMESEGNYLNIVTRKETFRVRETMTNMEKELANKRFIRCHKGYLVNSQFIIKVKSAELETADGNNSRIIPVGRSYEKDLRKKIMECIRN